MRVIYKWENEGRKEGSSVSLKEWIARSRCWPLPICLVSPLRKSFIRHVKQLIIRIRSSFVSGYYYPPSELNHRRRNSFSFCPFTEDRKERMYTTFVECPPYLLHKRKRIPFMLAGVEFVCLPPPFNAPSCCTCEIGTLVSATTGDMVASYVIGVTCTRNSSRTSTETEISYLWKPHGTDDVRHVSCPARKR